MMLDSDNITDELRGSRESSDEEILACGKCAVSRTLIGDEGENKWSRPYQIPRAAL